MEVPSKNFRWLVNHLTNNGNPLGLSLSRRYSDELAEDDAIVHFKDIADNRRILEATKDFTPAQKEFAGVTEMKAITRPLPDTRIPHLTARDGHSFTSKKDHIPEDNGDYEEENDVIGVVSRVRRSQKIYLALPQSVETRMHRFRFSPLGSSAEDEEESLKKICEDTTLDITTARTFLCLLIELRGDHRVGLETRFIEPILPFSPTRPTLLFRGEYVHKDDMPNECKVILVPFLEDGHWSIVTLDKSGTARFYDSVPRKTIKHINEVRQHYDLRDGKSTIVKCTMEPDPKANGVFMLLNTIAYLSDLIAKDFYDASNVHGIRKWLALVMVSKKIPSNYQF